uniref:C-factor n=1 Tax=Pseudonaja textilis TaxID=8673 RepID=A0A670YI77_PSETE
MAPLARSVLVTGSNRGIGLELIQQLVKMAEPPEHIFATCRTPTGSPGKEFLPLLKKAAREAAIEEMSCQRAAIINITSKLASIERGFEVMKAPMYPYRASKAALNMVTVCFALELKEEGILCSLIHPGWVKTDMGTQQAPVTVQNSVQGILNVLANLSSASNGAFLDWEGNTLPW